MNQIVLAKKKKFNEMVLNSVLLDSQIDAQFNCHQKGFTQQLMESETETHNKALEISENPAEEREKRLQDPLQDNLENQVS